MSTQLLRRLAPSLAPARALSRAVASSRSNSPNLEANKQLLTETLRELRASEHFDLVVIGSGPAGQKCAIDSAKHGYSVAIVDKRDMLGGVCVHTGTVPSKVPYRVMSVHCCCYC